MSAPTIEQAGQIQAILEALDKGVRPEPENRRRSQRVNVRMGMTARVLGGPATAPMRIYSRNLSRSGIGFISRRLFRKDERLAIELKLPGQPMKLLLAEVTFCRYVRRALYEAGARFLEAIAHPEGNEGLPAHWGGTRMISER